MRNLLISTAAAALVTSALPAAAQSAPMDSSQARQQQPARQSDRDDAGERRVCLNVQLSNSRIARRVCRTEREWAQSGELEAAD